MSTLTNSFAVQFLSFGQTQYLNVFLINSIVKQFDNGAVRLDFYQSNLAVTKTFTSTIAISSHELLSQHVTI